MLPTQSLLDENDPQRNVNITECTIQNVTGGKVDV